MKPQQTTILDFFEQREDKPSQKKSEDDEMKPCPICNVMPVTWEKWTECLDGRSLGTGARCPVCGYQVFTHYDIAEHWNKCNRHRMRDIMNGRGK